MTTNEPLRIGVNSELGAIDGEVENSKVVRSTVEPGSRKAFDDCPHRDGELFATKTVDQQKKIDRCAKILIPHSALVEMRERRARNEERGFLHTS